MDLHPATQPAIHFLGFTGGPTSCYTASYSFILGFTGGPTSCYTASYTFILGFTGGPTSCYTASYSFISAITDKSTRTIRSENCYFYFFKFQISNLQSDNF